MEDRPDRQPPGPTDGSDQQGQQRHRRLSARTRIEHDALLVALHRLEAALASAAPQRERAWTTRVRDDFRAVHDALRRHVHSSDAPDGLLAEILHVRPHHAEAVERLRREHEELCRLADDLETSVATDAEVPDFASIRAESADLLLASRRHHEREVDLIFEAFWTDIGVGD